MPFLRRSSFSTATGDFTQHLPNTSQYRTVYFLLHIRTPCVILTLSDSRMGKNSRISSLPLPLSFFSQPPKTVISTEAAHGLIVSRAVEKSASLPRPSLSQNALAFAMHLPLPCLLPLPFAFAFAFEIERGFQPASSQPQSGLRSAEDGVPDERFCSLGCNAGAKPEGRSD